MAAEPGFELGRGERSADVVPLGLVAAEVGQQFEGRGVLDPLGGHAEAQVVAEVDDRPDDAGVGPPGGHLADDRPVEPDVPAPS